MNSKEIFNEFASVDYDYRFHKSRVLVKLLRAEYMSRAEGRRLLHNLHKSQEIMLDFESVNYIGQGFADEVFRVFKNQYPEISIEVTNANNAVDAMIRHVKV